MKRRIRALFCTLLLCSLPACGKMQQAVPSTPSVSRGTSAVPQNVPPSYHSSEGLSSAAGSESESKISSLTLERKIGQMFFLSFRRDTDGTVLWTYNSAVQKTIRAIQPGGIVLFGENINTVPQVRELIRNMEKDCGTPPFIGVDQEGGTVQRIHRTAQISATNIPPMWRVGKKGSTALAEKIGEVLGSELTVFGFNLDFAPDCDVLSNPKNTVIGDRSFSSDPKKAAALSVAAAKGIRSQGIVPVCKHFPGHGDTSADTHEGYAVVNKTLAQLRQKELVPFRAQIAAGAEMIMAAHISLPKINGDNTPATMSPKVLQDLLRGELGFRGVIITDAMNMGAVANHYTSGEAAVRAIKAGADMILMPEDPQAAFEAVLQAVKSGDISEARIDESVSRILSLKMKYDLGREKPFAPESLLGCEEHRKIIEQVG